MEWASTTELKKQPLKHDFHQTQGRNQATRFWDTGRSHFYIFDSSQVESLSINRRVKSELKSGFKGSSPSSIHLGIPYVRF